MTCDEAIEKIRAHFQRGGNEQRRRAYSEFLDEVERVIRENYLNRGEQIHLLKTDPAEWNRWWKRLFTRKRYREIDGVDLFYVLECAESVLLQLGGADFDDCELSPLLIAHADLTGCSFNRANLEGSCLSDCHFHKVSFKGANLRHVDFSNSGFSCVDFDGADISYAKGWVYFYRRVRFGSALVKNNELHVTNHEILPFRKVDFDKHTMDGRIIEDGGRAKFFPFTHVLYDVDALT